MRSTARRSWFVPALLALLLLWRSPSLDGQGARDPFAPDRLMANVRTYYDFGVHRTSHPGDRQTTAWLAERFRALGLQTSTHDWTTRQFFLDEASLDDGSGRMPAFPIWLPRATGPAGVKARLVAVDAATPVTTIAGAIAWLQSAVDDAAGRDRLMKHAIAGGAAGVIFATSDTANTGLFVAQNANREHVDHEQPVPVVTFGSALAPRLTRALGKDLTLRITGQMNDRAPAANVLGKLVRRPDADWIVVSTPSSGWFTCGGERGGGVAILLALAEWAAARPGPYNYFFVANSGHELDYLGARLLHEAHLAPSPEKTKVWLHLGANIATPPWRTENGVLKPTDQVTTGTLQASPEFAAIMRDAFADLTVFRVATNTRIGEFRDLVEHGYRGLGIVGGSDPWFHVERDDPSAIAPATLSAVARNAAKALAALDR